MLLQQHRARYYRLTAFRAAMIYCVVLPVHTGISAGAEWVRGARASSYSIYTRTYNGGLKAVPSGSSCAAAVAAQLLLLLLHIVLII